MKKIVFFFIVGFVIFPVNSQPIQDWEFPIKPGTPEWRKLNTQSLKVQACQIPNDLLCNITTEKLVKLYLDYPLLINITAFSTFHAGIENLRNNFNGINELLSRNGSSELILEEYIKSNPNVLTPQIAGHNLKTKLGLIKFGNDDINTKKIYS